MQRINDQLERTALFVDDNFEMIQQEMMIDEWMHIVWAMQTEHNYDIRRMFRYVFDQEEINTRDFEQELKNSMGRQDATFESVA